VERFEIDCLVIGAGVVGLAVARKMALEGREVMVLEREAHIGSQTSSRNSEVIHAGIYYPQGSLKAELCVKGKSLLYEYCDIHSIPFKRCGKLIVATKAEQVAKLEQIKHQASLNGVNDLIYLSEAELYALEPDVSGCAALLSPSTGVLDSHAYMLQLQSDLEAKGGQCVFNSDVQIHRETKEGIELILNNDEAIIKTKCCINAAGLDALPMLQRYSNASDTVLPSAYEQACYAKGSYFSYSGKVPFSHLVYPVPEPGGLGVHLTLDMQGMAKFGPDVEWLSIDDPNEIDYTVDPGKKDKFFNEVRKYWSTVNADKMQADYSGVRPKLSGPGEPAADFLIEGPNDHGIAGLINLAGIESPGLTSSLAIANYVSDLVRASNL
jgi:L-2-hydroxyglutarate oxidase LhgO